MRRNAPLCLQSRLYKNKQISPKSHRTDACEQIWCEAPCELDFDGAIHSRQLPLSRKLRRSIDLSEFGGVLACRSMIRPVLTDRLHNSSGFHESSVGQLWGFSDSFVISCTEISSGAAA